jgi:restriction system protein
LKKFVVSPREKAGDMSKRIVLIDSVYLTRLMIRHKISCRIEETLHAKKMDEERGRAGAQAGE